MPRMKADSKGRFRAGAGNQVPGTRQNRRGMGRFPASLTEPPPAMFARPLLPTAMLALGLGLGLAGPVMADMTYAYPGVLESVTPGWFCLERPDGVRTDLDGRGKVNLFAEPFHFVGTGDVVPSQAGIGIGVVAQMGLFGRDDPYEARESHGNPCCGKEQRWATRVRPDGLVWLGYLNKPGEALPPGEWHFSLWRGADQVFSYVITVGPPDPKAPEACAMPSS